MPLSQPPARTARHAQTPCPRHGRTATTTLTVLGLALGGGLGLVLPAPASADPAPAAATSAFAVGDTVAGTVPDGVCSVVATVVGGAGGRSAAGAGGVGSNGAGAAITATFDVLPGTAFSGSVGGGGRVNVRAAGGAGGVGGGGAGGTAAEEHGGAGGGGLSLLRLGGTDDDAIAVLAGGGGGSGGGHSVTTDGFGGDAGLPTAPGQVAPGADGTDGFEGGPTVGGGKGGGATAPGAGGTHPTASLAGLPGVGRTGGAGAPDPNYDAGGGGGAGVFGAGGGASTTIKNQDNGLTTVAGGGGGGGSSLVAATARAVTATATGRQTGTGNGANGSITLDWVECAYDLAVTKTAVVDGAPAASPDLAPVGSTITWTVTVRNAGPQAMTRGDVVVLRDTLPGAGATFASATVAGGGNEQLERGALVCDATAGAAMPAALTCARPFAPLGGAADGVRGLDVGETLTVVYTQQVTDAPGTALTNVASVVDRGDQDDNSATSTVTVIGPPVATDDEDRGNRIGDPVTVPVLGNDSAPSGDLDPASVVLWDADRGVSLGTELVVPGEGTWTVDTTTGALTFTPEAGFLVDPTPVTYRVSDTHGQTATAVVVVTYLPEAADDSSLGHAIGTTVTVDVLANDTGDLDASSVRLVDGEERVTRLVVPGEGTWDVDPATGEVTFTPQDGFLVDPTPVTYEVTDSTGDTVSATVTVGYVPDATDDADLDNPLGTAVTVDVLANDTGDLDPTTVRLVDGDRRVTTLEVVGQGTWTVDPTTGAVTFTPQDGYVGNPTPVRYVVTDSTGDTTGAQVTVTYQPEATDDARHGNELGRPVVLDPLGNDAGDLDPATLRLVDPATGDRVTTLRVPGEGTWTVDPTTGEVTFTPEDGYDGNPTPQRYEVSDAAGGTTGAWLVVTFLPQAADDVDEGNVRGTAVTVDVVGNDRGTLDPTSVRLLDADGEPVTTLVVDGEGTWTVDPTTGAVTFTPVAGFGGDPTPVRYRVADVEGNPTEALVRVTYVDAPAGPTPAPTPTPTATPAPTPDLAVTGWGGWGVAALAGLLLVAGAGVLVLRRPTTR